MNKKEFSGEMKAYTVTGATGYIGQKIIEEIVDRGDYVYAVVRESSDVSRLIELDNVEICVYDGREDSLKRPVESSDYVIHLGALYTTDDGERSIEDLINSNILFSTKIFSVVNKYNPEAPIASASTFSSLNGEGEYAPATLYAATKTAVEVIAEYYSKLSINFLTFPDTFGPGDWRPKIHNILARNEEWPFQFRSSSKQEMRMLHVEDISGHIFNVLEKREKGVNHYDIYSEGILVNLKELSEAITDEECLFNEEAEVVEIPRSARSFSKRTGYTNKHKKVKLN